jgi:cytochrome c-type biogenesis protein CcmE
MTVILNAAIAIRVAGQMKMHRKAWLAGVLLLSTLACERSKRLRQLPVDELLRNEASYERQTVRATGILVPGSLRRLNEPCETQLDLQRRGAVLAVHYRQCVVPETLRELPGVEVEVVAEGVLQAGGHFEASALSVLVPDM